LIHPKPRTKNQQLTPANFLQSEMFQSEHSSSFLLSKNASGKNWQLATGGWQLLFSAMLLARHHADSHPLHSA
jgi:hypothetical protein